MKFLSLFPLLIALVLSVGACEPEETDGDASISGRVTTVQGEPIANVTVSTNPPSETAQTADDGIYVLQANVLSGVDYKVLAMRSGYATASANVRLKEGENRVVDFALEEGAETGLVVYPTQLNFGKTDMKKTITLSSADGEHIEYTMLLIEEKGDGWLGIEPDSLTGFVEGQAKTYTVVIDRAVLSRDITKHTGVISINGSDNSAVQVTVVVE